jgi:hypothetical protein
MFENLDPGEWAALGEGGERVPALLQTLADAAARPEARAQAHTELATLLTSRAGPRPLAARAVPLLVALLPASPEPYPVVRLLARLAEPGTEAERILAQHLPALLPQLENPDPRTRHALAHLLAHLPGAGEALAIALRHLLGLEKYEAVRASALLALGRLGRASGSRQDAELLHRHLGPAVPPRVAAAAAVALCWLDPAARSDYEVGRTLSTAGAASDLRSTELEWNGGDLAALARTTQDGH